MKKIISMLLMAAMMLSQASVFATNNKTMAAEELEKYGIVTRNQLGGLTIEGPVTRAMMAKMIVFMLDYSEDSKNVGFTDVPTDHWASSYIAQATDLGIINGMGDGTFAPDECVTYQQAVKMIVCALGYSKYAERLGGYPTGYVMTGTSLGIMPQKAVLNEAVDRGELMIMLATALDIPIMVMTGFGENDSYKVLDGKNGEHLVTLRTKLEE